MERVIIIENKDSKYRTTISISGDTVAADALEKFLAKAKASDRFIFVDTQDNYLKIHTNSVSFIIPDRHVNYCSQVMLTKVQSANKSI